MLKRKIALLALLGALALSALGLKVATSVRATDGQSSFQIMLADPILPPIIPPPH